MSAFQIDKLGGEFRVVDGQETYALWVPMTAGEKEALLEKAKAENVDLAALAANCLREWMRVQELSAADLEKVAGGAGGATYRTFGSLDLAKLAARSNLVKGGLNPADTTVMCPW